MRSEKFLQYIWAQHKWSNTSLRTTCKKTVTILDPGMLNHGAGPDFAHAVCKMDEIIWHGSIEVHCQTSGWEAHRHHKDSNYDKVMLHVVWDDNRVIQNSQGGTIPTLALKDYITPAMQKHYLTLFKQKQHIACAQALQQAPPAVQLEILDQALLKRLEKKSLWIENLLSRYKNDTETVVYQLLAYHFGFKTNSEAMLTLAQRLPIGYIRQHQANLLELEALLLGQAGLLTATSAHPYLKALKKAYKRLAKCYQLSPAPSTIWQWGGIRPVNTPTLRIAQLAKVLHKHRTLFSWLMNTSVACLRKGLMVKPSTYWQGHYAFGKPSPKPLGGLGAEAARGLIINVVPALLWAYGKHRSPSFYMSRAFQVLRALPPECNSITRMWRTVGLKLHNAFDTQAAIGLFKQLCIGKDCINCPIKKGVRVPKKV